MPEPNRALVEAAKRCARWTARRSRLPARAADRLGAHAAADKLYWHHHHGDVSAFVLPPGSGRRRPAHVRMRRWDGTDQVADATVQEGIAGFEPPVPAFFVEAVRETPGVVLDVGANTGFYSLVAAAAAPGTRVCAMEPFPAVLGMLRANLDLNPPLRRQVEILPIAIGAATGQGNLYVPPPQGLIETSASMDPDFKGVAEHVITVPVQALDDGWSEGERVTVIKIDTEGTEHLVLSGARKLLTKHRPVVIYELLPRAAHQVIAGLAAELDYVDVRLRRGELVAGLPIEFDEASLNHALVPIDSISKIRAIGARIGAPLRNATSEKRVSKT